MGIQLTGSLFVMLGHFDQYQRALIFGPFRGHKNASRWTKSKKCAKVHYLVKRHSQNDILKAANSILRRCEKVRLKNCAYSFLQCKMGYLRTFWTNFWHFLSTQILLDMFSLEDICINNTQKARNRPNQIRSKMTLPPPANPLCSPPSPGRSSYPNLLMLSSWLL